MKTSFDTSITGESCSGENKKPIHTKQVHNCRRRMSSTIILCLVYLAVNIFAPAEARISSESSDRHQAFDVIVRDYGLPDEELPTFATYLAGPHGSRRRRPRRSAKERDFIEFRKLLHQLRNTRRGARAGFSTNSKRNTFSTLTDRTSSPNTIAKSVKCGSCQLKKQWIPILKPGCRTNYVLAPTCLGMCETWQIPDVNPPYVNTHHRVCRPTQLEFRKIRLRRCQPGVNAFYAVPIAKGCVCMKCKSVNTACRPL